MMEDPDIYSGLDIQAEMESKYGGICVLEKTHRITKGAKISLVKLEADPPYRTIGWACEKCAQQVRIRNGTFEAVQTEDKGLFG